MTRPSLSRPHDPLTGDVSAGAPHAVATVDAGDAVVEIDTDGPRCVAMTVTIGQHAFFALFDAVNVKRWCSETAILLSAPLVLPEDDEVDVRSPMLLAQQQGCIAMGRRVADGTSALSLHFASSVEDLTRGATLQTSAVSVVQARALLDALQAAATAAQ
jgi:hypothetical protein